MIVYCRFLLNWGCPFTKKVDLRFLECGLYSLVSIWSVVKEDPLVDLIDCFLDLIDCYPLVFSCQLPDVGFSNLTLLIPKWGYRQPRTAP